MNSLTIFMIATGFVPANLPLMAARPSPTSATDTSAIHAVIETFRVAIIARDRAKLNNLVVSPTITFLASIEPDTLARVRTRRPSATRLVPGDYPAFVDEIVSSKAQPEETFDDIAIRGDGSVATAYFTYSYKEGGMVINSGHETWGLVATDDGWKISSIVYSITLPTAQR